MAKTVIYGGTFNPLHVGHAQIIRLLSEQSFTDELMVIPTALPPHKEYEGEVAAEHRLNMCRIAARGLKNVTVSDIELKRQGKSYTIDTVNELMQSGKDDIAVACGGDMLVTLDTWKNYKELISKVEFIALYRVGTDKAEFDLCVQKTRDDGGRVRVIEADIIDVASKDLRRMLKCGEDTGEYLSPQIIEYIKQNGLYV